MRARYFRGVPWMGRSSNHRPSLVGIAAILVAGALVILVPLGHASPPDPTRIAGFYDEGDYDDVVLAITGAVGLPVTQGPTVLLPDGSGKFIPPSSSAKPTTLLRITQVDRSPPLG